MSDIQTYLQQILDAVYGEEVRGSIHDAIATMNSDLESAIQDDLNPLAFKGNLGESGGTNNNLNNLVQTDQRGIWRLLGGTTYTNVPSDFINSKQAYLIMYAFGTSGSTATVIKQEIHYFSDSGANANMSWSRVYLSGEWQPWHKSVDSTLTINGAAADAGATGDLRDSLVHNRVNIVLGLEANGTYESYNVAHGGDIYCSDFLYGKHISVEITNNSSDPNGGYMYVRFCTSKEDPANHVVASVGGLVGPNETKVFGAQIERSDIVYAYIKNTNGRVVKASAYVATIPELYESIKNDLNTELVAEKNQSKGHDEILKKVALARLNLFPIDTLKSNKFYSGAGIINDYSDTSTDNYYVIDPFVLTSGTYYIRGHLPAFTYTKGLKTGTVSKLNTVGVNTFNEDTIIYTTFRSADKTVDPSEWLSANYCIRYTDGDALPVPTNASQNGIVTLNYDMLPDWWDIIDIKSSSYRKVQIAESYTRTYTQSASTVRFFLLNLTDYVINSEIKKSNIVIRFACNTPISSFYEEYYVIGDKQYDRQAVPVLYKIENGFYYYAIILNDKYLLTWYTITYDDISSYLLLHQSSITASPESPVIFKLLDAYYLTTSEEEPVIETEYSRKTMITNPDWDAMNHITVKKDGSGDFTTIQPAINSINDASISNQYVIDIYDDFDCRDLTELYRTISYAKSTEANPTQEVAMIVGKDWIHIRGMNGRRKLYIESPSDLAQASFPNIVVIRPFGNQIYENLEVRIKGGRYAIHHEAYADRNYHKTVKFCNMIIQHYGNQDYPNSAWTSSMAQANGTSAGTDWYYDKCTWIGSQEIYPYYTHENMGFDEPCHLTFKDCTMIDIRNRTEWRGDYNGPYFGDIGSNQLSDCTVIGCDFPYFSVFSYANTRGLETEIIDPDDIRVGGIRLYGHANGKMLLNQSKAQVLGFVKENIGTGNVEVTGGSAYDILWGETFYSVTGTANAAAQTYGIRRMFDRNAGNWGSNATNVYSLAGRLGNCATSTKTLIIKVNSTNYTITFNKNYMTSNGSSYTPTTEPYMNNQAIINDINTQLANANCPARIVIGAESHWDYFSDEKRPVYNFNESDTIVSGSFVVQDRSNGMNGWKHADDSTTKEDTIGMAARTLNPKEAGEVILLQNTLIPSATKTVGSYWKFDNTGELIETDKSNAIFVATAANYLEVVN